MYTDFHTHSIFSGDARDGLEDMVISAVQKGCGYFAATEHCNLDFDYHRVNIPPSDLAGYAEEFRRVKKLHGDKIRLTYGIELGFDGHCNAGYSELLKKYGFEYVINSVHLINGEDCYNKNYFDIYNYKTAIENYLKAVRQSLDVPYRFDALGHFGYVTRNCPAANADMYAVSPDLCDDILKTVIERGIILEANSAVLNAPKPVTPAADILRRYRELGGELIIYGSDAHSAGSVCRSRGDAMAHLAALGFRWHTVLEEGKKKQIILVRKPNADI